MVRDQRPGNRGGWVFIKANALPAERSHWHAYDDDDWRTCPADSN
jgi:hypothetical protein